ncbi:MAG TPA: 50S ribosomal protein L9, partial [Alphaproteobacteria bacterium]|nr:50S ribosomal protein L9 [Alphaproteobacteria bacterium]
MEVILLERVHKLGQMGDVVKVKDGFARNFLLPRKKALRATKANREQFEQQKAQLEATNLKLKGEAEKIKLKLDGQTFTIIRQAGETGMLYGSVSSRDVADVVTAGGFTIARSQSALD